MFPLDLFPQGGLSSSVITTVWIGVAVVAYFNLRFGWVLSGLVVPGYLVPLLVIQPWSAAVVILEGVVTYLLVWSFSERLSRHGWWGSLFGRDRFFALILFSIVVRVLFDGWVLPAMGAALEESGIAFDYRNKLHSFGLVIVALVANQFWKTGVWRGLPPLLTTLAITYLIVRYPLMEFTNFGLGAVSFLYEDLASSILASPKAYIVLVTTAFVASRMNLHYGWEFNGILLPALLALQWYEPLKLLVTFAESFIILGCAILVLRLPVFADRSIEGAHKLLLFFNIGFVYKLAVGYLAVAYLPQVKVSDLYGFGYLLSTLLALKMHDKGIAVRLTRATLQTSLVAVAAASGIGFALTLLPGGHRLATGDMQAPPSLVTHGSLTLAERVREARPRLYEYRLRASPGLPLPEESAAFVEGVEALLRHGADPGPERLAAAAQHLAAAGYRVEVLGEGQFYLGETPPGRGWGTYVLRPGAASTLVIEVPMPLEGHGLVDDAVALFGALGARALAIADPGLPGQGALDRQGTLFQLFHRRFARGEALQVRAHTPASMRALAGSDAGTLSGLWLHRSPPPGLDLVRLERLVGDYALRWNNPPFQNLQRHASRGGFAELFLAPPARQRLLYAPLVADVRWVEEHVEGIEGYLQEWLLGSAERIGRRGSGVYRVPELAELLYLDREVLSPLEAMLRDRSEFGDDRLGNALRAIDGAARVMGYRAWLYRHVGSGSEYLVLSEADGTDERRYWGTYVYRLGPAEPYVIQVPRPGYERSTFEFGVAQFERLRARLLMIAGTHPLANPDRSADLVSGHAPPSLFNLVGEVAQRESGASPLLVAQSRAFARSPDRPLPDTDLIFAPADEVHDPGDLDALSRRLLGVLEDDGWRVRVVDGSAESAGYQVGSLPQARYRAAADNVRFALLWVSPEGRAAYRQREGDTALVAQFPALGLGMGRGDLHSELATRRLGGGVDDAARARLDAYLETLDIVELDALRRSLPDGALEYFVDTTTGQHFLFVGDGERVAAALNLQPRVSALRTRLEPGFSREDLERALDRRGGWLEFAG